MTLKKKIKRLMVLYFKISYLLFSLIEVSFGDTIVLSRRNNLFNSMSGFGSQNNMIVNHQTESDEIMNVTIL